MLAVHMRNVHFGLLGPEYATVPKCNVLRKAVAPQVVCICLVHEICEQLLRVLSALTHQTNR